MHWYSLPDIEQSVRPASVILYEVFVLLVAACMVGIDNRSADEMRDLAFADGTRETWNVKLAHQGEHCKANTAV
jgi:hypothetical protein